MTTPHSSTRATVLVVEDDQDLRPLLAEALEEAGFAVAESADVADARARLEGFAYDALVVDLSLPDGDGMQRAALTRSSATRPSVPSSSPALAASRKRSTPSGSAPSTS